MTEKEKIFSLRRKISKLQKENTELKIRLSDYEKLEKFLDETLKDKLAQIEKMKNCGNCKHYEIKPTKEKVQFCCKCKQLDKTKDNLILTKWELAE